MTVTTLGLNGVPARFLGAYIKNISGSLGLSNNSSSVSITLVEDPANNVWFQEPEVGEFHTVQVGNSWNFSGIITKFERDIRNEGGRTIRVTINDPKEIMGYIPVIIAPGSQTIATRIASTKCSVLDVFGAYYVEGTTFNMSGWSEAGMPYSRFATALKGGNVTIGSTVIGINRLVARAYDEQYRFNLDEITNIVEANFQINTNLTPLSNIIEDIAQKNSFDWYIECERASDGIIDVTVKVVDRSQDNIEISLLEFLNDHPDKVTVATSGVELKNDLSCAVLVGAPVEQMRKVPIAGLANEPIDLAADSGSNVYVMSEEEMRSVLIGKQTWEIWLGLPSESGGGNGFSRYGGALRDDYLQPVIPSVQDLVDYPHGTLSNLVKNPNRNATYLSGKDSMDAALIASIEDSERRYELVGRVFEKLKSHAEATYGKRFVHEDVFDEIIDSCWTRDVVAGDNDPYEYFRQEDGRTRGFVEFVVGTSSGEISTISTPTAAFGNNAVFRNVTQFGKTFESQFSGNLFDAGIVLNLENITINLNDIVVGMDKTAYTYNRSNSSNPTAKTSLYCACTIDKDGVVRIESPILEAHPDENVLLSRLLAAVNSEDSLTSIEREQRRLEERITELNNELDALTRQIVNTPPGNQKSALERSSAILTSKILRLNERLNTINNQITAGDTSSSSQATDADGNEQNAVENIIRAAESVVGPGLFNLHPYAYQPAFVHIPTRSRYARYGPTFPSTMDSNTQGKLEIIQDDGFCPWEFGSVSLMSAAMQLKIDNIVSQQKEVFSGTVTVEGFPQYKMGDFVEKNSNITSMSITFGTEGGVTTTYQLQSYSRKFGEFTKEDWARLALFANGGGSRILPQRLINFIHNGGVVVNKQFTGRGSSGAAGGARNFG